MRIEKWLEKNTHSLKNTTVVITGSTGGLGKEISFILASIEANLIFANRDKKKSQNLIDSITKKYPNCNIEYMELNLVDINSINKFITDIKDKNIDIFIHNAGIYNVNNTLIYEDIDNIFLVNFLAPYYINNKIIPLIKKNKKPKIIVTSSIAHNFSKIDPNNVTFTNKTKNKKYGNSKRYLTYSSISLLKDSNINLAIVHPGITLTNMTNHYPKFINWLVKIGIKLFFPTPKKACLSTIYAVCNPCKFHHWIGPKYFNIWGYPKMKKLNTASKDEEEKIFEISNEYYKKLDTFINKTINR